MRTQALPIVSSERVHSCVSDEVQVHYVTVFQIELVSWVFGHGGGMEGCRLTLAPVGPEGEPGTLARIIPERLLPFRTIRRTGFDSGLLRPSLRAYPQFIEGLALRGCESTLSKPATKILLCLQVLIHEFPGFVNYAG
jgi:hypothetical protein